MALDQWIVDKLAKAFFARYGKTLRPEMRKWGELAEEARLIRLMNQLAACGKDVILQQGVQILAPQKVHLGSHVGVGHYTILRGQGGITIEDFSLLGDNVILATAGHPLGERYINNTHSAPIHIGQNVWLAAQVIVLPGVTIGENSAIGAGAVVTKDIPPHSVAVGVPAEVIRSFEADDLARIEEQKAALAVHRAHWGNRPPYS